MGMVGLVFCRDGGGGCYACGSKIRGLVVCREIPEISRVHDDILMTSDYTAFQVRSSG